MVLHALQHITWSINLCNVVTRICCEKWIYFSDLPTAKVDFYLQLASQLLNYKFKYLCVQDVKKKLSFY